MKRIKPSYMSPKYLSILVAVLVLGCSEAEKPICTVNKLNTTGIQEGEAIVVLSINKCCRGYHEEKIGECISKALKKQNRKIEIFPSDEFRRTFFPDLNLPDDYSTEAALDNVFTNEATLQHIESFNIHYVVVSSANTAYKHYQPLGIVAYYHQRENEETYVAGDVFDIKQKRGSGRIDIAVKADWTNRVLAFGESGFAIPIPLYYGHGKTYSEACKAFGEEVVKFLMGQETNK